MILTAREALQALLDGKTLREGAVTIIPMEWGFRMQADDGVYKDITLRDCEVVEDDMEYPFNFEQALRAMLDGKIVEDNREKAHIRFNHELSILEVHSKHNRAWVDCIIWPKTMKSKWKVVE